MPEHVAELMRLSRDNLSAREIAAGLGRTEEAVHVKARQLGLILSPRTSVALRQDHWASPGELQAD